MARDTRELFSVGSGGYAAARPHYPRALFEFLVGECPDTHRAWDCGTGSGQAAVALAEWFAQVDATDVSAQQIAHAAPHARVRYAVQPAERCDFPDHSFSLVSVAQALHWFDFDQFWPQVHRVLKPGGLIAAWTYTTAHLSPSLDALLEEHLLRRIHRYWAPQNRLAWDGYATIPFPFDDVAAPAIDMRLDWTLPQFIAYLQTWSATRLCTEAQGPGYFVDFTRALAAAWGDPEAPRPVHMEFYCRVGRRAR